jgi:hypothetical protein
LGIVIDIRPVQEENALDPIEIMLLGIVIDVKPVQLQNALFPIEVTPSGIVIDVRPVHWENADTPIVVTLLGMVTDVRPLQPQNASSPIEVTPFGIVTAPVFPRGHRSKVLLFSLYNIPFVELYNGLLESTFIVVSFSQLINAHELIEVTPLSITTRIIASLYSYQGPEDIAPDPLTVSVPFVGDPVVVSSVAITSSALG